MMTKLYLLTGTGPCVCRRRDDAASFLMPFFGSVERRSVVRLRCGKTCCVWRPLKCVCLCDDMWGCECMKLLTWKNWNLNLISRVFDEIQPFILLLFRNLHSFNEIRLTLKLYFFNCWAFFSYEPNFAYQPTTNKPTKIYRRIGKEFCAITYCCPKTFHYFQQKELKTLILLKAYIGQSLNNGLLQFLLIKWSVRSHFFAIWIKRARFKTGDSLTW